MKRALRYEPHELRAPYSSSNQSKIQSKNLDSMGLNSVDLDKVENQAINSTEQNRQQGFQSMINNSKNYIEIDKVFPNTKEVMKHQLLGMNEKVIDGIKIYHFDLKKVLGTSVPTTSLLS